MKSCPTCKRTYADDTLTFCLVDGSILSAPYDPNQKQPYSDRDREPPATEIYPPRPAQKTEPQLIQTMAAPSARPTFGFQSPQPAKGSGVKWLVAAGLAVFLVLIGAVVFVALNRAGIFTSSPEKKVESDPSSSSPPTTTVNDKPSPATTKASPTPNRLNLVGTWSGKWQGYDGTIVIDSQEGDAFSGTLSTAGYVVRINGQVNSETRQFTFDEAKVLKRSGRKNEEWSLGTDIGLISNDGQTMKGKGKDKTTTYAWSFSRKQ